jgi:hypothetical protein
VQYSHFFEPLVYTAPEAMPTKPYPEQNIGPVDVFSLGAILFHLLTCLPPYKGSDEGSLETERRNQKGTPEWPGDSRRAYAPGVVELVEAMLQDDPAKRPSLEHIIQSLSALQADAQKSGAEAWHPSDSGTISGSTTHTGTVFGDSGKAAFASRPGSSSAVVATAVLTPGDSRHADMPRAISRRTPMIVPRRSALDVFLSTLLICMTITAFLCVAYLTAQPYLSPNYQFLKKFMARPAEPAPAANAPTANGTTNTMQAPAGDAVPAPPEQPVDPNEAALARHQLDQMQVMLRDGQILDSAGAAKVLRDIAERAGRASPAGIRALILAGEVESRVASRKAIEAQAIPIPPKIPNPKNDLPAEGWGGGRGKEPELNTKPGPLFPPVKTTEIKPEAPPPPKAVELPKPVPGVADAISQARSNLKYFGYSKAKEIMEQFAAKGDAEQKRVAADFQTLINYEEGLYERSRAKLLDQIKRHPKHESPLQLFPRKDDPVGDDIIDFDDKGLHILVRGGPNRGVKITPWDKFPPATLLNLLIPLAASNSVDDQLGLAVFSFNRGLKGEVDNSVFLGRAAEQQPNGKEKSTTLSDIIAKITRLVDTP